MLLNSSITNIEIYSDAWRAARLGKFTASNMHVLMGARGIGDGGIGYIRTRVGEELSGIPADKDVLTEDIQWGIEKEPEAIRKFMESRGIELVITQKLIAAPDSRFSCTPDVIHLKEATEEGYNVEVSEVKCFQLAHHMAMLECEKPEDIKENNPKLHWQLVSQMHECGALTGNAIFYNPTLRLPNLQLHIVSYRKVNMMDDFRLLKARRTEAEEKFIKLRDKLLAR